MENSSLSHGYFPAGKFRYPSSQRRAPALRSSKYSLLTLLVHLRLPNPKTNQPKFCKIHIPRKIVFSLCSPQSVKLRSKYKKIARDSNLLEKKVAAKEIFGSNLFLGEPRLARLAAKSMGGNGCRPQNSVQKIGKSDFSAFILPNPNLFSKSVMNRTREARGGLKVNRTLDESPAARLR